MFSYSLSYCSFRADKAKLTIEALVVLLLKYTKILAVSKQCLLVHRNNLSTIFDTTAVSSLRSCL